MPEGSRLLRALSETDRAFFAAHCESVVLVAGDPFYEPGDIVDHVYFPCEGAIAAFLVLLDDGRGIETALVGSEGAVGGIVSNGRLPAFARSTVIIGGRFLRLPLPELDDIKRQSRGVNDLLARYADCLLAQVFQSVACNVAHLLEQRAAKWIVASVDRTGNPAVEMTQEQFASLLGVGRSYASRIMQRFKKAGLIETRRGGFIVLDLPGLRAEGCRCNDLIRYHFDEVLEGVYPTLKSER